MLSELAFNIGENALIAGLHSLLARWTIYSLDQFLQPESPRDIVLESSWPHEAPDLAWGRITAVMATRAGLGSNVVLDHAQDVRLVWQDM